MNTAVTNMNTDRRKTVLLLSYGPVPTPQYQKIEGGGMRAWGLAEGMRDNGHDVTVAVNGGFPQDIHEHEGVRLTNWNLDPAFVEFFNSFDCIILSYCMGDASVFVVDHASPKVTVVLDCYVPIYIEVSARNSENVAEEYQNYFPDIQRFNHVLRRGDYFLCANPPQKHMYTGILGSLGVINPRSYNEGRLLVVPFGINAVTTSHEAITSPYGSLNIKSDDFVLLWFGALYPWFDFKPLIVAIRDLAKDYPRFKFVLVGGKNPYNNHPDFVAQYDFVKDAFDQYGLTGTSCHFIDWVDFDQRDQWYRHADVVISLNRAGEENIYSWRTRVMDYVWGELPMLTNGGDPLSDYLVERGAAAKINTTNDSIKDTVAKLMASDGSRLKALRGALRNVQSEFYWPKVTAELAQLIVTRPLPYDEERIFEISIGYEASPVLTAASDPGSDSLPRKLRRYAGKAREKGLKRSLIFGAGIIKAKAAYTLSKPVGGGVRRAIFLSHPLDDTGAPKVLLDLAQDFKTDFKPGNIHLAAPRIERHLLRRLNTAGFVYHKIAEGVGSRIINLQLNIQHDDYVLMNTVAVHENYKQYVYNLLETGRLKKATWFIHEDMPEIRLTNLGEVARIKRLIETKKLKIVVPSRQTAEDYNRFLDVDDVTPVNLRVDVDTALTLPRPASDFKVIRFVISGTPSDGRKGQMLFLSALQLALSRAGHRKLREFEIHFISIGDDYISEQLKAVGNGLFGKRFFHYPKMPRSEALAITSRCNVTVCTSLNETFALFVAEGMLMSHVIIRNRTSGWNEQMQDGKNGYLVDNLELVGLADAILRLLDPEQTSNANLQAMGACSRAIADDFQNANYRDQLPG